jgi:hypothetical protein
LKNITSGNPVCRYYYDRFFAELRSLGETGEPHFAFEDLKAEFSDCFPYGFITGCGHALVTIFKISVSA